MRKVIYEMEDDLTGEPGASTVYFTYAGRSMEIDLTPDNKKKLDEFMAAYMESGRRAETLPPKRKPQNLATARNQREQMTTVDNHVDMAEATPPAAVETPTEAAMKQYSRVEILPAGVTESNAIRNWWATQPRRFTKPLSSMGRIPAEIRQQWIDAGRPITGR